MDSIHPTEEAGRDFAPEPQYEMHAPLHPLRADHVPLKWPEDYGLVASVQQDEHDLEMPPEHAIEQAAQVLEGVGHELHEGDIMSAPDGTYFLYQKGTFVERSGARPDVSQDEQVWWQQLAEHPERSPTRGQRVKAWVANLETRDEAIWGEAVPEAKPTVLSELTPAPPGAVSSPFTEKPGRYEAWFPLGIPEPNAPLHFPNDYALGMTVEAQSLEDAFAQLHHAIGEGDYVSAPERDYRVQNGALVPEPLVHEPSSLDHTPNPAASIEEVAARHMEHWYATHPVAAEPSEEATPATPSDVETGMDESDLYQVWKPMRIVEEGDWPLDWPDEYDFDIAIRAKSLDQAHSRLTEWMEPGDFLAAPDGKDYRLMEDGTLQYESRDWIQVPYEDLEKPDISTLEPTTVEMNSANEPPPKILTGEDLAAQWRERVTEQIYGVKPGPRAMSETQAPPSPESFEEAIARDFEAWKEMHRAESFEEAIARDPNAWKELYPSIGASTEPPEPIPPDWYLEEESFWRWKTFFHDDPCSVRVGENQFWIVTEDHPCPPQEKGFGGQTFRLRFDDGRLVVTENLWFSGTIPPEFREHLAPNAAFLSPEQYHEEAKHMEEHGGDFHSSRDGTKTWTPAPTQKEMEDDYAHELMCGNADHILDGGRGAGYAEGFRKWQESWGVYESKPESPVEAPQFVEEAKTKAGHIEQGIIPQVTTPPPPPTRAEALEAWRHRVTDRFPQILSPSATTKETIKNVVTAWETMMNKANTRHHERSQEPSHDKAPDRDNGR